MGETHRGRRPAMTQEETISWCADVVRDYIRVGLIAPGWGSDLEARLRHGPAGCGQPQCSCHHPPGTDLTSPGLIRVPVHKCICGLPFASPRELMGHLGDRHPTLAPEVIREILERKPR